LQLCLQHADDTCGQWKGLEAATEVAIAGMVRRIEARLRVAPQKIDHVFL